MSSRMYVLFHSGMIEQGVSVGEAVTTSDFARYVIDAGGYNVGVE